METKVLVVLADDRILSIESSFKDLAVFPTDRTISIDTVPHASTTTTGLVSASNPTEENIPACPKETMTPECLLDLVVQEPVGMFIANTSNRSIDNGTVHLKESIARGTIDRDSKFDGSLLQCSSRSAKKPPLLLIFLNTSYAQGNPPTSKKKSLVASGGIRR
jgi:hypothetical protein